MPPLLFSLPGGERLELSPELALAAGFTGRDPEAVAAHIAELEAQGIPPPDAVPVLFPLLPLLLFQATRVPVIGPHTTPEVEPVLLFSERGVFLTVGSDHTDRALEASHVTLSKNVCPKVLATEAWPVETVLDRWERLGLEASSPQGVVQRGTLAELLPYPALVRLARRAIAEDQSGVLFCGTIPARAPWPPAPSPVTLRLTDPESGRAIEHRYTTQALPERY